MKKNIVHLESTSGTGRALFPISLLGLGLLWASFTRTGRGASFLAHQLETEVEILAPPSRVWEVLTDTAAYPAWNPVIVRLEGQLAPGQMVTFENRSGGRSMVFQPTVLEATPDRTLRWLGRLWLPGLFDGEHFFELTETAPGVTHLRHGEQFRGLLVPLVRGWLDGSVRDGFVQINVALKLRAQAPVRP